MWDWETYKAKIGQANGRFAVFLFGLPVDELTRLIYDHRLQNDVFERFYFRGGLAEFAMAIYNEIVERTKVVERAHLHGLNRHSVERQAG